MHLRVAIILASLIALPSASNQATPPQSQASGFVNTLMPQPSQLSAQEGRLTTHTFLCCYRGPLSGRSPRRGHSAQP